MFVTISKSADSRIRSRCVPISATTLTSSAALGNAFVFSVYWDNISAHVRIIKKTKTHISCLTWCLATGTYQCQLSFDMREKKEHSEGIPGEELLSVAKSSWHKKRASFSVKSQPLAWLPPDPFKNPLTFVASALDSRQVQSQFALLGCPAPSLQTAWVTSTLLPLTLTSTLPSYSNATHTPAPKTSSDPQPSGKRQALCALLFLLKKY